MLALFCFKDLITESHALSNIAFANEKLLQRITASPILTADDRIKVYMRHKVTISDNKIFSCPILVYRFLLVVSF